MRVLIISGSYPPINCGIGYYTKRLEQAFEDVGFEDFTILSSNDVDRDPHVLPWVEKWSARAWPQIVRAIKQTKPDVVHLQFHSVRYGRRPFSTLLPGLIKARFPKLRQVVTLHEYHDTSSLGKWRILSMIAPVRDIIVSNQEDKAELQAKYKHKNIQIIPIGPMVEPVKFSSSELATAKREYNPHGKTLITTWGIIDAGKGTDQLVLAMSDLEACRLVIVGEYDQHQAFHRELKALIAASKADIEWVGFLDDAATSRLLQITNMVVLPYAQPVSLRRSTLLSSLVHGKAVVTTGPAALPLSNKQNCFLIDSNDPDTIVNAVEELRNNPKLCTMLAERAARLAADFNWERIANKHVEFYKEILAKRQKRSK